MTRITPTLSTFAQLRLLLAPLLWLLPALGIACFFYQFYQNPPKNPNATYSLILIATLGLSLPFLLCILIQV